MTTTINIVTKLISRKSGATVDQLQNATGWQPHSIRAVLTGLRKKGVIIKREANRTRGSIYKVMEG
jgi:predicted transcriptional regulator